MVNEENDMPVVEEMRTVPEPPPTPQVPARRLGTTVEMWGGLPMPRTVSETVELAQLLAKGGPGVPEFMRGNPGAAWMVIQDALAFGMPFGAVARQAFEVNGRVAYMSQLITALIKKRAPIKEKVINPQFIGEGDKMVCRLVMHHAETGEVIEYESPPIGPPILTTKEQKNPPSGYVGIWPKNSQLWRNDPKQQLVYYSMRAMARRHFPDILQGIYDYEEALEMRDITPRAQVNYTEDLIDPNETVEDVLVRNNIVTTPEAEIIPPDDNVPPDVKLRNIIKGVESCATKSDLEDLLRDSEAFLSKLKKDAPDESTKFWRRVIDKQSALSRDANKVGLP